jgi:NodT family efflux transporter outer membrane factor (OMF) lipoprotein
MRLAWIFLPAILFGANAPKVEVPAAFHSPAATGEPVAKWWTTLNDPELTSLEQRAVAANLDLKIAASRVLEARAARKATRADLLPSVSSNSTVERERLRVAPVFPAFESGIFQMGFDASWEIDLFGGRRKALAASTADAAAMEEARRDALVSLTAEVARNYAELRGFQKRLDITERNLQLQRDSLDLTKARAEAGLGTQLDVERQNTQLESTGAAIPALKSAIAQTIHRLSVLLGEEPGKLLEELSTVKPLPSIPVEVPAGLPGDLLKRRPDIREAGARIDAETARLGVAHADLFPKIFLNGAAGRQAFNASGLTLGASNFFSLGPAMSLPIFTGGKLRANIAAQKERLDQAVTEYQSTVLHSLEETEDALTAYAREKERRERLAAAVESSRLAVSLSTEVYTRGLADFLTVLDAQRQQLSAEDDLAQSDTAVVSNLVALYKALGGGWN